jgi:hypothetical protein
MPVRYDVDIDVVGFAPTRVAALTGTPQSAGLLDTEGGSWVRAE